MIALEKLDIVDEAHDRALLDLWIHDFGACVFSAADEVGIFVALAQGPQTAAQLADRLRLEPSALLAVCRALVSLQGLVESNDTFDLSAFSQAVWVKQTPCYRGREFDRHRDWEQHQRIVDTLEGRWAPIDDGQRPFSEGWRDGDVDPQAAYRFTRVMHSMIFLPSLAAARSGALSEVRHLLDVGGGSGIFSAALIAHQPEVSACVLDLPQVCEASRRILRPYETAARVKYHPCNFFHDPWPAEVDGVWLSNVLHDWPVETCKTLLKKAYHSLPIGGRIVIHEALLDACRCSPRFTTLFHLLMLMNHRGQQFTKEDLFGLLLDCGFTQPRVVFGYSVWSVIEGRKTS